MSLSHSLPLALAAMGLEALIGYPAPLYRAIGHPVTWMGAGLGWLEARLNRRRLSFAARRALGALALMIYLAPVALVAAAATRALAPHGALGFAVLALLAARLPAQRLAALWIAIAAPLTPGLSARHAVRAVWSDAAKHRSPNAGWPEAAMAGALGLSLAGPRIYGETLVEDAFMGDGRREANAADIRRGLRLYRLACVLQALALAGAALIART